MILQLKYGAQYQNLRSFVRRSAREDVFIIFKVNVISTTTWDCTAQSCSICQGGLPHNK